MGFSLANLLALPPVERTQQLHHCVFDDFIRGIGGCPFQERFDPPGKLRNADYLVPSDDGLLILELKQLTGEAAGGSLGDYLDRYVQSGQARPAPAPPGMTRFDHTSLAPNDWGAFNRSFRKSVPGAIKSGYKQLKQSSGFLVQAGEKVACRGLWLHNAGDLHMPPDLLARQALIYVQKEWKSGFFRSLDFVICTCWDLWDNPWVRIETVATTKNAAVSRPPFQWHSIFPGKQAITETRHSDKLRASWIEYTCKAYGAQQLDYVGETTPLGALTRFAFPSRIPKIGWATLARTALVPIPAIPPAPDPAPPPA